MTQGNDLSAMQHIQYLLEKATSVAKESVHAHSSLYITFSFEHLFYAVSVANYKAHNL